MNEAHLAELEAETELAGAESATPSASAGHASLAEHAARCALALSRLQAPRPADMQGELALHTALACGTVAAMHFGGVGGRFEFFITGEVSLPPPLHLEQLACPVTRCALLASGLLRASRVLSRVLPSCQQCVTAAAR